MMFVSFAQNLEDVMLWRALKDVREGFYIDVGAADPDEGSVTRAFYDRGWHGINLEPEPGYAAALREKRPRDVNLEVAIGHTSGRAEIYLIAGTGLSTFDGSIAARHEAEGYPAATVREVTMATLAEICTQHAPPTIHFLKIDVEGSERDVLLGADFRTFRPWIIVVEATKPFAPVRITDHFEDILLAADYRFCWFDGLNAFYLAAERDDTLRGHFEVQANVHDAFVDHKYLAQAGRADQAETAAAYWRCKLDEAQARITELDRHANDLVRTRQDQVARLEKHISDLARMNAELAERNRKIEHTLSAILISTSWQITAPLRRVKSLFRH